MADALTGKTIASYGSLLLERYRTDGIPLRTYREMLDRDPIVAFANGFVQRSTLRRLGDFEHEREDVTEWVTRCVMPALKRTLRGLQTALYYGVAIAQPRWEDVDGELTLAELIPCDPERFWTGRGFERDDQGRLVRVWIDGPGWVDFVSDRGVRQLVHYASGDAFGSPWGNAIARRAYTGWFIKRRLVGFEAIGLEKHGLGTAVVKSDDDAMRQAAVDAWGTMGSENAIGLGTRDELDVVSPGWTGSSPYSSAIARLDGAIFNSFMLPHLLLAEAQFGTRAQASVALEAYLMAETEIADRLADIAHHQVIRPAIALRFGRVRGQSHLNVRDGTEPDREQLATIVTRLSAAGAFDPRAEDQLRWAGRQFEVPMEDLLELLGAGETGEPA